MSTGGQLDKAIELLATAGRVSKVILFGSAAEGRADEESDLDLVVILTEINGRRAETVRLLELLRPLRLPVDVLVYSEEELNAWGHLEGTVLHEALTTGKVLYEAA